MWPFPGTCSTGTGITSIFNHSFQSRCSSRQSAHHAGSCGGNVPLMLLPAEATVDYQKLTETTDTAKTLAQVFVGDRLDYCKSLLYGVSKELLRRLQSVWNAAAWFITGTRKYDHTTLVLRNLHWLPVRQRITFKIAILMYRCLNGLAASHLAADCIVISAIPGRRRLRSATSGHSKNQDIWTKVIQGLWSNNLERFSH